MHQGILVSHKIWDRTLNHIAGLKRELINSDMLVNKLADEKENLEGENKRLRDEVAQYTTLAGRLTQGHESLFRVEGENRRLKDEVFRLEALSRRLTQDRAGLFRVRDIHFQKNKNLAAEKHELSRKISSLEAEVRSRSNMIKNLSDELQANTVLCCEYSRVVSKVSDLESEVSGRDEVIKALIDDLDRVKEELRKHREDAENKLRDAKKENNALRKRMAYLESHLSRDVVESAPRPRDESVERDLRAQLDILRQRGLQGSHEYETLRKMLAEYIRIADKADDAIDSEKAKEV